MANEPNNAEEQLKQYAEDRRQMVPGEIHPATRNMLQGEVARTYGAQTQKRAPVRMRWLPALVWILILGAIPLFFLPRNPESKKSQEALPAKENEVVLPSQSQPGEAPIELSDTATPVLPPAIAPVTAPIEKDMPVAEKAKTAAPVAREELAADSGRDVSVQKANARNMVPQKLETRQISPTAGVTPASATAPAPVALSAEAAANNQRLSFVNIKATPQALNNFQMEQTGARIKVLDADGSVYPGRALTNGTFHVAGMNKTLNKPVVFTGQVTVANSPVSNLNVQDIASNYRAQNVQAFQNVQNQSVLNNNAANVSQDVRVQGQATVGSVQYKIDAQARPTQ
jgi:hypothetical protein